MTPNKHLARIQYGTKGDGTPGTPPVSGKSSSFSSDGKQLEAARIARQLAAVKGHDPSSTSPTAGVVFKFTLPDAGSVYSLDSSGKLTSNNTNKVFVKLVPDDNGTVWHIRTMFPTG